MPSTYDLHLDDADRIEVRDRLGSAGCVLRLGDRTTVYLSPSQEANLMAALINHAMPLGFDTGAVPTTNSVRRQAIPVIGMGRGTEPQRGLRVVTSDTDPAA